MRKPRIWIGIGISSLFLYLAFRKSDFSEIGEALRNAHYGYLLITLVLILLAFFLRAVRWRYLLEPSKTIGLHSLFSGVMIGFMSLNVLPLRIGEFVRAYVLGRRENISKSRVFATIVVERIFDGFTLLLFLIISIFIIPFELSPETMIWIRSFSYFALAIYLIAMIFLILLKMKSQIMVSLLRRAFNLVSPRISNKIIGILLSFITGLEAVGRFRNFCLISFYSVLIWMVTAMIFYSVMLTLSVGRDVPLAFEVGFLGSFFVLGVVSLGIMIPSSPGFVGTFQWACKMALVALGISATVAETYSILLHASQYLPITMIGIFYFYHENLTFKEIQKVKVEI